MLTTRNLLIFATLIIILAFLSISFSLISAAETQGSLGVNNGGGSIIIDPKGCQEDWSGSTWGQCRDGQQTFICFDKNSCGAQSLKPALCGETRSCNEAPPITQDNNPGGGGGGGGSGGGGSGDNSLNIVNLNTQSGESACVEKWECSEWSNVEDQCGERSCEDLNACRTEELKPVTENQCPNFFSSFFSFLTGGVIGALGTGGAIAFVFIIIIAVGTVIVFVVNRKGTPTVRSKPKKNRF